MDKYPLYLYFQFCKSEPLFESVEKFKKVK